MRGWHGGCCLQLKHQNSLRILWQKAPNKSCVYFCVEMKAFVVFGCSTRCSDLLLRVVSLRSTPADYSVLIIECLRCVCCLQRACWRVRGRCQRVFTCLERTTVLGGRRRNIWTQGHHPGRRHWHWWVCCHVKDLPIPRHHSWSSVWSGWAR